MKGFYILNDGDTGDRWVEWASDEPDHHIGGPYEDYGVAVEAMRRAELITVWGARIGIALAVLGWIALGAWVIAEVW